MSVRLRKKDYHVMVVAGMVLEVSELAEAVQENRETNADTSPL